MAGESKLQFVKCLPLLKSNSQSPNREHLKWNFDFGRVLILANINRLIDLNLWFVHFLSHAYFCMCWTEIPKRNPLSWVNYLHTLFHRTCGTNTICAVWTKPKLLIRFYLSAHWLDVENFRQLIPALASTLVYAIDCKPHRMQQKINKKSNWNFQMRDLCGLEKFVVALDRYRARSLTL